VAGEGEGRHPAMGGARSQCRGCSCRGMAGGIYNEGGWGGGAVGLDSNNNMNTFQWVD
jgi:hypothetical protein